MKLKPTQLDKILALVLLSSVAACGPGAQQSQTDEPAAAQPAATADAASGEATPMPDRFANMFVTEVSDAFNPGVQIGTRFPAIKALYQGEEITTIDPFIRDKGAIFIAARSVDW
jgi:hypothetical protein